MSWGNDPSWEEAMPKTTARARRGRAWLWNRVIEPWLEEIARDRRRGSAGMALFDVCMGLWLGGCVLLLASLAVVGLGTLLLDAPVTFAGLALGTTALVGLGWLVWTFAGDGTHDREKTP